MSPATLSISGVRLSRHQDFTLTVDQLLVQPGAITCITGANGSGKTTLLEIAVGLLTPKSSRIEVFGESLQTNALALKRQLGFIPDDDQWLIPELTAKEYFELLMA